MSQNYLRNVSSAKNKLPITRSFANFGNKNFNNSPRQEVNPSQKSSRVVDYKKYLQSPTNSEKKLSHCQSAKPTQDPESVTHSRYTESDHSSIIQSSMNHGEKTNRIHVFPFKKMMPEKIPEHQYPRTFGDQILSATKQRVLSDHNSSRPRYTKLSEDDKAIRNHYLKQLIDPDNQSVPIDSSFKGFSFIKRSALSPKNKHGPVYKEKVLSLSPKNSIYKFNSDVDKNIQKRVQLAKL
jgi:hypothetical protein